MHFDIYLWFVAEKKSNKQNILCCHWAFSYLLFFCFWGFPRVCQKRYFSSSSFLTTGWKCHFIFTHLKKKETIFSAPLYIFISLHRYVVSVTKTMSWADFRDFKLTYCDSWLWREKQQTFLCFTERSVHFSPPVVVYFSLRGGPDECVEANYD